MFKYLMNKFKKKNDNGFSLVELVVAMSILLIIMPATVGIMKAATSYKNQALQSNQNLVHSSGFNTVFRSDIENAVGIKIVPGTSSIPEGDYIKLKIMKRSNTGSISYICKDWRKGAGANGLLKSKTSTSAIASPSSTTWKDWTDIFDGSVTKAGKSGKIFVYENGSVTYDIKLGKNNTVNDYTGTITPNYAPVPSAPCW